MPFDYGFVFFRSVDVCCRNAMAVKRIGPHTILLCKVQHEQIFALQFELTGLNGVEKLP